MGDILFLAHRVPYPPDRGDKIRGFHIVKYLSERQRVHMVAFADDERDLRRQSGLGRFSASRSIIWRSKWQWVAGLQALMQCKPLSLTAFDNAGLRDAIEDLLARHSIETIYVFSGQMAQYLPARASQRLIMDFVDVDSAKFESYAQQSGGLRGWMLRREAKLLARFERSVAARVDASLLVSEQEATLFRERSGAHNVHAVENGIDTDTFDPGASFEPVESTGALIVFTGQMDYHPNIEAVTWFVDSILPHVRSRHPEARFAIVGRNPTDQVRALARDPGVIVTGEVADVRGWLAAASVVVAPLKIARGIQNKVLEAMAMARPVVASAAAAEGIDHAGTVLVGDTSGNIADHINRLLDDPAHGATLGKAARVRVQDRYSWEARLAPLDALIGLIDTSSAMQRRSVA